MGAVSLWIGDVEVPREDREGLEWSSVVPGGDDRLSVTVKCDSAFFAAGVPLQRAHVEVRSETNDGLWVGWLRKPNFHIVYGKFVGLVFEAEGYQYSGLVWPFEDHVVYGPASVGSTSIAKVNTASIVDAIDHARTQKTPLITNTKYLTTGFNLDEDSESFFGRTAVDVWNVMNNLMGFISNPLFWQVYSIDNLITLEFFAHPGVADYWERGKAKEMNLEFDANDVVWRCVVAFGGEQTYIAPALSVTPAIATPYTQGKVLNLEAEARSLFQVTQVGESVVSNLNVVRITGGTVTIDEPLDGPGCLDVGPEYLRAGRMIDVTIPLTAAPYNTNNTDPPGTVSGFMYIRRCSYSEEGCEASLSASPYTDEAKAIRMLPFQMTPGLTWGIAFGSFNPPPRGPSWYAGDTTPPVRADTDLTPITGSMVATGYRTDTKHDYGSTGGIHDPRTIPKNVVTANYNIEGLITDPGVPGVTPPTQDIIRSETNVLRVMIPEMVVERIALLGSVSGSITIRFHKFARDTETTSTNFIGPASLSTEQYYETVVSGSEDPAPGDLDTRKIFHQGDWCVIDVDGDATAIKKLGIGFIGRKISESYAPPTQGPGWVNRPASPTYPHAAGYL